MLKYSKIQQKRKEEKGIMKRMKKFAALLLVVAMTFGMVACSSSDKKGRVYKKMKLRQKKKM